MRSHGCRGPLLPEGIFRGAVAQRPMKLYSAPLLLLAAMMPALPSLYWDRGPETAPDLKRAGVECIEVPAVQAAAWAQIGFCNHSVAPADLAARERLTSPGVHFELNLASATRSPWVDANGWRFERLQQHKYLYEVKPGVAPLAAAEVSAYGADAWLQIDPQDLEAYGRTLAFLKSVEAPALPPLFNIALVDDGSSVVGEVMNLLSRRNLLFHAVARPDPHADLSVELGSKEYPKADAADPSQFAEKLRSQLTDAKRLLRIYGSNVVIGRLTGDGSHARLHLLNYGRRNVDGLRVRVLGSYAKGALQSAGMEEDVKLEDFAVRGGGTEFSIPGMGVYAVVDLFKEP
jgi:hypothetical protein